MGPTASGKTGVAVELAQTMPVEIISVDSALVYRGMNIGTAKPDDETLARAPHHLIDIINPTEAYSAAAFRHDALRLMRDITARGKVPLLTGGTMLYFRVLQHGLSPLPEADPAIRASLDAEIAQHGIEHLHKQLAAVDAETAARLKPADTQRIQRAMEIFRLTGQPMSLLLQQKTHGEMPYRILPIALIPSSRSVLHQRIAARFKHMLEQGLVNELRALRKKYPLHPDMTSMRCVGYRQAWQFIEGEINEAQLLETGIAATRQLAKRQLTWLRAMPDNIELDCLAPNPAQTVFDKIRQSAIMRPMIFNAPTFNI
ncbi:MAG: tRNA (adenosine(37)-N6)-dimethylallyltransferase MiaA [Betaproteobacteria bacterium RBG_16_56_24]|nr:MAG: tRNA (adenosine(37)-N6)-dimethylallyltransferase MiaA [Betaproteobacteria bacterium RBG_16_56_24]